MKVVEEHTIPKQVEFAIITALEEERIAVLSKLADVQKLPKEPDDTSTYYDARVATASGTFSRVIVTSLTAMGPPAAVAKAQAVVDRWHPRRVLLVGIACGVPASGVGHGDVLIAPQIADATLGKVLADGTREIRWEVYRAGANLLDTAMNVDDWQGAIDHPRPGPGAPKRHTGVIVSGGDVVTNDGVLAQYRNDWPKIIGIEMEAGGVAMGVHNTARPPEFLMIKAVSDFGTDKYNEAIQAWRPYACDAAAAMALAVIRSSVASAARTSPAPDIDQSAYIRDKSAGFVGRDFAFEKLDEFLANSPSGYFLIIGEPGCGKSALAAEIVRRRGYVHHFFNRLEGIVGVKTFLASISRQLSHRHAIGDVAEDTALAEVFARVSKRMPAESKAVIVIDALDEAERSGKAVEGNPLLLPAAPGDGIYLIVTLRRGTFIRTSAPPVSLELDAHPRNADDVKIYVRTFLARPGIRAYMERQRLTDDQFVDHLGEKSEGNFMYLRHVLPEIESGAYATHDYSRLPLGLVSYYEDHWRRMKGREREQWVQYRVPVLLALAVIQHPASLALLVEFSGVDRARILDVLSAWREFLHEEPSAAGTTYRLYHDSFRTFIADKEHANLQEAHQRVARHLQNVLPL